MKRTIASVLVAIMTVLCIVGGGYSESDALNGGIEAEEIIPDQLPEPEQESEEDMATGDKLVNLDDLKVAYDKQQEDTNALMSALNYIADNVFDPNESFANKFYNEIGGGYCDGLNNVTGIGVTNETQVFTGDIITIMNVSKSLRFAVISDEENTFAGLMIRLEGDAKYTITANKDGYFSLAYFMSADANMIVTVQHDQYVTEREFTPIKNTVLDMNEETPIHPYSEANSATYNIPQIGYYWNEIYQKTIRGKQINRISVVGQTAGTFSIVKAKNVGTTGNTATIIKTVNIILGKNSIDLDITLADDEWLGFGYTTDTGKIMLKSNSNALPDYYSFWFYSNNSWVELKKSQNAPDVNVTVIVSDPIKERVEKLEELEQSDNPYRNKSICAIGDSITNGYNTTKTYLEYLADALDCNYTEYGDNGSTIANGSNPMYSRVGNMANGFSLVFAFGGTNDFALQNRVLGDMFVSGQTTKTPNEDPDTFYGGLNLLYKNLLTKYPNADIYAITPLHRGIFEGQLNKVDTMPNSAGLYLSQYVEAVKTSAAYFSIPVIDLWADSGMNPNISAIASAYFNHQSGGVDDLLHPDANGHKRMAEVILRKIL